MRERAGVPAARGGTRRESGGAGVRGAAVGSALGARTAVVVEVA